MPSCVYDEKCGEKILGSNDGERESVCVCERAMIDLLREVDVTQHNRLRFEFSRSEEEEEGGGREGGYLGGEIMHA